MKPADAAEYLGYTVSYVYQLTRRRKIPHHKPVGGLIFFQDELDEFLNSGRVLTTAELDQQAGDRLASMNVRRRK